MKHRFLSQEALKLIACVTMLLDHIGAIFVPGYALRCIGRLSFPIFCFLIAEGAYYTRDSRKYALRMLAMAVVTELIYDLAFYGGMTWRRQNVMVTLLLGFLALQAMKRSQKTMGKILLVLPFALVAELLRTDYGAEGVLVIALFGLTRGMPRQHLLQFLGLAFIFGSMLSAELLRIGSVSLCLQDLGVLAIVPIALYSGKKRTNSKWIQWGFYWFYPGHLLVLYGLKMLT